MPIKRPLSRTVPVRVSYADLLTLRRWARRDRLDVSKVVRELIEHRRRSEASDAEAVGGVEASVDARTGAAASLVGRAA